MIWLVESKPRVNHHSMLRYAYFSCRGVWFGLVGAISVEGHGNSMVGMRDWRVVVGKSIFGMYLGVREVEFVGAM